MKRNAAKEYLEQVGKLDAIIDCKLADVDRLYARVTRITPTLKQDAVSGGRGGQDQLAETVAKLVDLKREINADVDRLVDLKREIAGTLERLKQPNHYRVLYDRYVLGMTWDDIAADMGYCKRNVQVIHGGALAALNRLLDEKKEPGD